MNDEITHFEDLQRKRDYEQIEMALKQLNKGRNQNCFPLVSFGWKDADLEPEGCTGIKSIVTLDEYSVTVLVGGHKTFCPKNEYEPSENEQFIIDDIHYPGYWSGDDWTIYTEPTEVKVNWVVDETLGGPNYNKTAELIVSESKKALSDFETTMQDASLDWDSL